MNRELRTGYAAGRDCVGVGIGQLALLGFCFYAAIGIDYGVEVFRVFGLDCVWGTG